MPHTTRAIMTGTNESSKNADPSKSSSAFYARNLGYFRSEEVA